MRIAKNKSIASSSIKLVCRVCLALTAIIAVLLFAMLFVDEAPLVLLMAVNTLVMINLILYFWAHSKMAQRRRAQLERLQRNQK